MVCEMKCVLLGTILLLLSTTTTRGLKYTDTRTSIDPSNVEIVEAGDFVLQELRKLSDSGIYETLKLKTIVSAETMAGAYHDSIFMQMQLTSPYLEDTKVTTHDVVVMRNVNDNVRSFAIDEFPKMNEDAIEEFWIRKVERAREFRENEFARIERDEDHIETHQKKHDDMEL